MRDAGASEGTVGEVLGCSQFVQQVENVLCRCHISPHVCRPSSVSPGEGLLSGITDRHKEGNSLLSVDTVEQLFILEN